MFMTNVLLRYGFNFLRYNIITSYDDRDIKSLLETGKP